MNKRLSIFEYFLLSVVLFFAVGYILYPLWQLVGKSFDFNLDSYKTLGSPSVLGASINSVVLSVITVFGCAAIGIALAYYFHFYKLPFKKYLSVIFLIPLATPPIVGVVSFLYLLSDNGILSRILALIFSKNILTGFDGWKAIIIIHLFSFYPLFYLFASASLEKFDYNVIDASNSLGASRWTTFRKIVLPFLLPSAASAGIITFMASMASFSAPFVFGGSLRFLTTEIYYSKINGDTSLTAVLSVFLTFISVVFLFLLRKFRTANEYSLRMKGSVKKIDSTKLYNMSLAGKIVIIMGGIFVLLPVLTLLYLSLIPEGSLIRNYFGEAPTLENYIKIFTTGSVAEPYTNSLVMSLIAVIATVLIGLPASYLTSKKKIKGGNLLEGIVTLPYGIPGTVIAIFLIFTFNSPKVFSFGQILVGTFAIMPLAYTIRNIPAITQSLNAGFNNIDPSLEEASYSLGGGKFKTFYKIVLPLIVPAIISGALIVFINSFGEFVSSILLYTFSTKTISIDIYSQLRLYNTGGSAASGFIMFLIVLIALIFSRRKIS
ncbi:MAG: iron ABC transporter permease [Ignavibacteria bacterium]|nr:iron ABC transporter permease [Ignavibacteria bacterium]